MNVVKYLNEYKSCDPVVKFKASGQKDRFLSRYCVKKHIMSCSWLMLITQTDTDTGSLTFFLLQSCYTFASLFFFVLLPLRYGILGKAAQGISGKAAQVMLTVSYSRK